MPNYNYMPNSKSDFPHIDNVDVYKFDNDFDYSRYDYTQMELQICTVPWDMGEAHIGNRTISGIGNVVYFETKQKRDEWFDAIPDSQCYRFETKFKELHRDHIIDVPIPYDMCAKHNYLVVRYALFANDDSPVMYEGEDGLREWFWFIREVEFIAPNTTRLHLLDDAFQTWIYDVNVSGMILERGHAPMFDMKTTDYLSNPLENNSFLLTEDVNYGQASQVTHIDDVVLNAGTMYACIATTANPTATWTNVCPASAYYTNDGVPSVYVFAVQAANLNTFLSNVDAQAPQFKQTVQGVFFASNKLVTIVNPFTFCGVSCYGVSGGRKTIDLTTLAKSQFGYGANYADIAKLYTWPYAHIEVTDENGDVTQIKIEDTTGKLQVNCALSLAFPFVNIDAHLTGVGGSATKQVTFKNVSDKTFDMSGQWYDTLKNWSVPTFAVVLDAAKEYGYSTKFDRAQRVVDYTTTQANDNANAQNVLDNASVSNTMATANRDAGNTAITTNTDNHNIALENVRDYANQKTQDDADVATGLNQQATSLQNDLAAVSAGISGSGSIAGGVVSLISSLPSMTSGSVVGGMGSLAHSTISAATASSITLQSITTDSNIALLMELGNDAYAQNAIYCNNATTQAATIENAQVRDTTINLNNAQTANGITATNGYAANDSGVIIANATRDANAAQSAIDNDIAQAALREPFTYGSFANGDTAVTRPIGLFSHIVTQSKAAIEAAGDYMLRYGYALDRYWEFDGNWNIGKHFTYWKLRDFWVTNLNVPDMYMDKIRFFLFGGVTIWRNPEDIGRVDIYENFNG